MQLIPVERLAALRAPVLRRGHGRGGLPAVPLRGRHRAGRGPGARRRAWRTGSRCSSPSSRLTAPPDVQVDPGETDRPDDAERDPTDPTTPSTTPSTAPSPVPPWSQLVAEANDLFDQAQAALQARRPSRRLRQRSSSRSARRSPRPRRRPAARRRPRRPPRPPGGPHHLRHPPPRRRLIRP